MELRGGDTVFPVDYRNRRVDPSRPFSLSFCLPVCIPVLHGSARPVLPWQRGLVRHGEEYGGRKERKKGKEESTCSPLPAAETLRESRQRDKSSSPTSFIIQTYLPFSIHTDLSTCLFPSYLNHLLVYLAFLFLLSPLNSFPAIFVLSVFSFSFFSLCLSLPPLLLHPPV